MSFPAVLRLLGPSARPETRALSLAAACSLAGAALDLALPWPLAVGVDAATEGRGVAGLAPASSVVAAGCALVAVTAVSGLIDMCAVVSAERAAERVGARLRSTVFRHAITRSLRWHDTMRSGEMISRITTDTGRLLDALVALCCTLLPDAIRLLLVLTILLLLEPTLAIVALAVLPLLFALAVRQRRLVRGAQSQARESSGRFSAVTVDLLRNVRAIQAFGLYRRTDATFAARNHELLDANSRAVSTEARWGPAADIVLALGSGLTLVVGGRLVLDGQLSPGELVVAAAYVSALYSPVRGLSRLSGVLAKSSTSALRVGEVLGGTDSVADSPHAITCPPVRDEIRLHEVRFGYDPQRPVLDGLSLSVPAGRTVCLLGPSGIGKSTILHLLLRLYDVDGGSISFDGRDTRDLTTSSLRRQIAFVPQDPWLFDASVADNIAAGSSDATWHGVLAAAHDALAHEFVAQLPDGYDTVIGEGGVSLSGGQRRRIAIARALVSNASVLLLDEPTASLDADSTAGVHTAIRSAALGRTVLIVTHDHLLTDLADRVIRLDRSPCGSLCAIDSSTLRKEVTS